MIKQSLQGWCATVPSSTLVSSVTSQRRIMARSSTMFVLFVTALVGPGSVAEVCRGAHCFSGQDWSRSCVGAHCQGRAEASAPRRPFHHSAQSTQGQVYPSYQRDARFSHHQAQSAPLSAVHHPPAAGRLCASDGHGWHQEDEPEDPHGRGVSPWLRRRLLSHHCLSSSNQRRQRNAGVQRDRMQAAAPDAPEAQGLRWRRLQFLRRRRRERGLLSGSCDGQSCTVSGWDSRPWVGAWSVDTAVMRHEARSVSAWVIPHKIQRETLFLFRPQPLLWGHYNQLKCWVTVFFLCWRNERGSLRGRSSAAAAVVQEPG